MAVQADLDRLDAMIASGVLSTFYDGKKVEYRSMDELMRARAHIAAQIQTAVTTAVSRNLTPAFDKGV